MNCAGELKLLIVEDDEAQVQLYNDAIDESNRNSDIQILPEVFGDLESGLENLKSGGFDAAIVDLKLGVDDSEGDGNKIIREIKENLRFPVFVMSGFLDELDSDLREQNIFYRCYERTKKETGELLGEITSLYNTGITRILGNTGIIEGSLHKVFWEHIAKNMEYWKNEAQHIENPEKTLSRHVLAYLSEYIKLTETEEFDLYHPAEIYLISPVKEAFYTGDILKKKDGGEFYVILTPACDMTLQEKENGSKCRNAEKILLVSMIQLRDIPKIEDYILDPNNSNKKKVVKYIKNTENMYYHFLPPFGELLPGFVINFRSICQIEESEFSDYDRIASIDLVFLKNIISRFTSYYARQGQPEFNIDTIFEKIKGL
ncbi:MAG: hypothetical protein SVM80_06620 [Halobacteriota archaeon]|nr:hypothetical protein [Halobacteriota archaeon]